MAMPQISLDRIKTLYKCWGEDRVASNSAALSYYTIFSLAPILLICLSIAGALLGEEAARSQIFAQISGLLGKPSALQIQDIIQNLNQPKTALFARLISILILLFSASGVFSEIQEGLNIIWGVESNINQGWLSIIKNRFISFAMVLVSAFLLLVSLLLNSLLAILSRYVNYFMGMNIFIELVISYLVSFFLVAVLFAMMFKYLPDIKLRWYDVWIGALMTSLLFSLGQIVIGIYLNQTHISSVFGATGSLIVLLIWVYYSAQIFFIGAEITKIRIEVNKKH